VSAVVWETHFMGVPLYFRGKVRDLYELGDSLLIVATDRLSAFDVVLPTPIPDKGRVLTQLSLFWFEKLRDVVPHPFIRSTAFHTGDEGHYRPRRKYFVRPGCGTCGRPACRATARNQPEALPPRGRVCRAARDHLGRHQV